jgi:hypothetical protein
MGTRHRSRSYASKVVGTAFGTARLVELALSADGALLFRSVRPFHHRGDAGAVWLPENTGPKQRWGLRSARLAMQLMQALAARRRKSVHARQRHSLNIPEGCAGSAGAPREFQFRNNLICGVGATHLCPPSLQRVRIARSMRSRLRRRPRSHRGDHGRVLQGSCNSIARQTTSSA